MKKLMKWGLAAVFVMATAIPAMAARSWVVCVDENKDARFSTQVVPPSGNPLFFAAAAPIYPGTTSTSASTTDCTSATVGASQVGTFFTLGGFIGGLPGSVTPNANDAFYVIWHFRIATGGSFDTTGIVRGTSPYPQTIIGSTNPGLVPTHGKATVTTLTTGTATTGPLPILAIKITTP